MKLDVFTRSRLCRAINDWRQKNGNLPTVAALNDLGFSKQQIDAAVSEGILVQVYVQLTNGSTVKAYKVKVAGLQK